MKVFAGIEGGASSSKLTLITDSGQLLATQDFPEATNHWLIGEKECILRIGSMIERALQSLQESHVSRVDAVCLCLSGCEDVETNHEMALLFIKTFPQLTQKCFVYSDTFAPLIASSHEKGVVLIAGTGSNCLLVKGDGSDVGCGGWGHVIGDEGSAFWIAKKALKAVINAKDNYQSVEEGVEEVHQLVMSHFGIKSLTEILDQIYANFDKKKFSSLARQLAELDNPLARDIFRRAGVHLGRHVRAVLTNYDPNEWPEGVPVVCVGSVFKSWSLLSSGFSSVFGKDFKKIKFFRIKTNSAIGAALLAARDSGHPLHVNSDDNCELLAEITDFEWTQKCFN